MKGKIFLNVFFWVALCFFTAHHSFGQSFYKYRIPKTDVFSVGIGPSFIYSDNAGDFTTFTFEWNPSLTASYTKRLSSQFGIQTSLGLQQLVTNGSTNPGILALWERSGSAVRFRGTAIFADVVPILYVIPYKNHFERPQVNLYGGLGIGVMHVFQTKFFSMNSDAPKSKGNISTGYIPLRGGISFKVGALTDIALEGTALFTFSDNLDGNANYNSYNDFLAQAQVTYKRFFSFRKE